jgi:ADP-heptose:LPS heptosyltransferase
VFECKHLQTPDEITLEDCRTCAYRPMSKTVLIKFPHGLGDAVAFTAVLAHLAKFFPDWMIDLACHPTYKPLFMGKVRNVLSLWEESHEKYDQTFDLLWQEGQGNTPGLSSTKAVRCLTEVFGIRPESGLLAYSFTPGEDAKNRAAVFLNALPRKRGIVAIHYEGVQCREGKDLPLADVRDFCARLVEKEYVPLLLDWSPRPALADDRTIFAAGPSLGGVDVLAALLSMTALNVCIDSGPQKLAMTCQTPLLCVWRKAHPFHYVDRPDLPARCVHLLPAGHEAFLENSNGVDRHCDKAKAVSHFREHLRWFTYDHLSQGLGLMADYLLGLDSAGARPTEPLGTLPQPAMNARKLLLHSGLPPGDIMTMTAAVEMLHEQHPGKFVTAVSTPCAEAIWEHNKKVVPADNTFERVEMHYHTVNESGNRPIHFLSGYTEFLAENLRIPLKLTTNRPHLYLSEEEKGWMNQVWEVTGNNAPYWIVNAGVKRDYTCKGWGHHNYQAVVDALRGKVRFAQVGLDTDLHKPLSGVVNLIGKTSQRALIRLVYHCQGVLCGVTWLMHLSAAFGKPSVILAGGREPVLWNSYPCQHLLHTIGSLPCCKTGSCWRSKVTKADDPEGKDTSFCERPLPTPGDTFTPQCMEMIRPAEVVAVIERCLVGGECR